MADPGTRTALVAGGSGALGRAIVARLAADGIRVYAGYHRRPNAVPGATAMVRLELADRPGLTSVCEQLFATERRLDILVNAAGINREGPALSLSDEDWDQVLAVNLTGVFALCRAAAKFMLLGRSGCIVNVSSAAGRLGGRGQANYAASKAGVERLTRVLALELGRKGVRVNGVAPGIIESPLTARLRDAHHERLLEAIAVRHYGQPADVAGAVAFLVSAEAAYITGQVLAVDGGLGL